MNRQRIGILGGGQLGRMLIQKGMDWNLSFSVLDPDPSAPCSKIADFTAGKLTDFDTVVQFGSSCDIITIEIENVNTDALQRLQELGKKVYPQPKVIRTIQNKRLQKQFFTAHEVPTAEFVLTENKADVKKHERFLPAVHKLGQEGYDGRGVQVIRSPQQLDWAFDAPGLLEKFVDFEKEISVIVARNSRGDVACYPAVEMVFHPEANLVEYLISPARLSGDAEREAEKVARRVIEKMDMVGVLAVEMFVIDGRVLVNEVAPRPHNSGHQTIEGNVTSQYEQHLRAILDMPLGDPSILRPSAMVNLLGEEGHTGPARYEGMDEILELKGAFVHLYGKVNTKPFRKMGHVTLVDDNIEHLLEKVNIVKTKVKVKA